MNAKQTVLREFPSAWFNAKRRTIEGYSESLVLGRGSVTARSVEQSAWNDALRNLARLKKRSVLSAKKNPKRAKLSLCPFDGGKARLVDRGGHLCHAVECRLCHASTGRFRLLWMAVDRWNQRA